MKVRSVILAPDVQDRLDEIARYTQMQFGRAQRVRYIDTIFEAIESLKIRPDVGRTVPGLDVLVHRHRVGSHFVYYKFDALVLNVLSVLHIGMVPSLHLEPEP